MEELTIGQVREIQLQILDSIDDFCKRNHLEYSLGGGTLLGAVRHKGYIPWDDDIDIMMPRDHYEIFVENYQNLDFQCICGYQNSSYRLPFAKVADNHTILFERGGNGKIGVNIDVFPIDGLPSDDRMLKKHLFKINKLRMLINYYHADWELKIIHKKIISKILPSSLYQRILRKLCIKYNFRDSDLAGAILGVYQEKEIYPRVVFEKYDTITFENRFYQVIAEYDKYLKQHYGDYMQLPPKEKQVSPHDIRVYKK